MTIDIVVWNIMTPAQVPFMALSHISFNV